MHKSIQLSIIIFSTLLLFFNCTLFSLRPPPITFTQTATAAEKQMLGDDKDIEKEGWLLSSIRTSSTGSNVWEREILDKNKEVDRSDEELFISLRKLAYFAGELRTYKKKGFIGEALDGQVKINPNMKQSEYFEEYGNYKQRIEAILPQDNETRAFVKAKRIQTLENDYKDEKTREKRRSEIHLVYYKTVESGEFFEFSSGKWKRKE